MARPPSDARDRALGAAIAILSRDGGGSLTMGSVAKESGVSKGGVLHHFPTKDALMLEVVVTMVAAWEAAVESQVEADPEPVGRYIRAFMSALAEPQLVQVGRGLLAAAALNDEMLAPMRAVIRRCHKRIAADGIDSVTAYQCVLVADALWYGAIFDLPPPPDEVLEALRKRLDGLTRSR